MEDSIKFSFNLGTVEFDFANRKIIFDRNGPFAGSLHLTSMKIDFADITDVEMRPAKLLSVPVFCFIVKGKRLITDVNINATQFTLNRADAARATAALERLVKECNLTGIKEYERPNVPKEIYVPGTTEGALYTIRNNSGSTLDVFDTYIELCHQNLISTVAMSGNKGKKRISIQSISAVDFKKAMYKNAGYIQFSVMGAERHGGTWNAAGDENSILINESLNDLAQEIVDYIEQKRNQATAPQVVQTMSAADELKKFKELLDMGIITQEEFDAKKKQLLGL